MLLPFPRYVYGRMTVGGELRDDRDQPLVDKTNTEMLVIELLDNFQVIDKKVSQAQRSFIAPVIACRSFDVHVHWGHLGHYSYTFAALYNAIQWTHLQRLSVPV